MATEKTKPHKQRDVLAAYSALTRACESSRELTAALDSAYAHCVREEKLHRRGIYKKGAYRWTVYLTARAFIVREVLRHDPALEEKTPKRTPYAAALLDTRTDIALARAIRERLGAGHGVPSFGWLDGFDYVKEVSPL